MAQPKQHHRLSAAARKRISDAQKARWERWQEQRANGNSNHVAGRKKPPRSVGRFEMETTTYKAGFKEGFESGFQVGRRSA